MLHDDDPHYGVDFYTPEQKRKMYKASASPKPSMLTSFGRGVGASILGILYIGVWIVTIGIILIVGIAVIKWAIEELAK